MTLASLVALLLGLGLTGLGSRTAHAQEQVRIHVALVDSLTTPTARAEVVRFPDASRPTLVLLRAASATPDDVIAALSAITHAKRRPLPPAGAVSRLTVLGAFDADAATPVDRARASAIIRAVRAAPLVRVGNLGRGRWVEIDATP